jgi:hypothetical protein
MVNLNDAIAVMRHVVGLEAPKPGWMFFDEASVAVAALQGLDPGTLPQIQVNLSSLGPLKAGLVAVLRGDVDGSYQSAPGTKKLEELDPEYFQELIAERGFNPAQFGIYGPGP